jgi:hypothetical protein
MSESDEPTTKTGQEWDRRKSRGGLCSGKSGSHIWGTSLLLLQVNCRSICNKILEFWNFVHTYKPDVICTESRLNVENVRDAYIYFRRDRYSRGGGIFICVKNYIDCRELWTDGDFEMVAVEIKGRKPKIYIGSSRDTQNFKGGHASYR